jgi:hypothetical protein
MSNRKKLNGVSPVRVKNRLGDRVAAIQNTFSGRYNGYICAKCGKGFLTLDVDPGVTPMFSRCFATEGCRGQARSMGYPDGEPDPSLGDPIIHWVKPSPAEFKKLPRPVQEHVLRGGLVRKATDVAPDWVKLELASE